jgi:excisionase family DNA binding protein
MAGKEARSIRWARETQIERLPEVMTVAQAARYLGIGRNAAYEAARRGELPAIRIGRRVLVSRIALERTVLGLVRHEGGTP